MLILTNIKTSRVPNRVNLIFSDGFYLPFFIDDVVKLSLRKNQSIDSQKLSLLKSKSFSYLGREYALRQIAISPKSKKKLSQKLKNFLKKRDPNFSSSEIIDDIISDLESKNLLNQKDFVSYFINKNHHRSQKEIIFRLYQEGVILDRKKISQIIPNMDQILIQKFLQKKIISSKDMENFNYRQKVIASLFRRGFSLEDIKKSIDDYLNLK